MDCKNKPIWNINQLNFMMEREKAIYKEATNVDFGQHVIRDIHTCNQWKLK